MSLILCLSIVLRPGSGKYMYVRTYVCTYPEQCTVRSHGFGCWEHNRASALPLLGISPKSWLLTRFNPKLRQVWPVVRGDMKPECGLLMLLPSVHHALSLSPPLSQTLIFELRGGGFFAVVVVGLLAGGFSGE